MIRADMALQRRLCSVEPEIIRQIYAISEDQGSVRRADILATHGKATGRQGLDL